MSHFHQRKEKNCLNCGTEVLDRYCHHCGQENVEPKQTVGHLLSHFFNDVTHFDGNFFSTIGTLIRRPGFLAAEYVRGRRMAYLDPVRMYIFTSAVFFLLFFGVFHNAVDIQVSDTSESYLKGKLAGMNDEKLHRYTWNRFNDSAMSRKEALKRMLAENKTDSTTRIKSYTEATQELHTYDSLQEHLPAARRDNWLRRKFKHRLLLINQGQQKDRQVFWEVILGRFLHLLPQLLFVSLPLFAFLLKGLYRRKKEFYYTSHSIFSIHLYVFTFITMLVMLVFGRLYEWSKWRIISWIELLLFLSVFFYLYKAMRRFYEQGRFKTILKFLLLNIGALAMLFILFTLFILFSLATVAPE